MLVLLALGALAPASAQAVASRPGDGVLSPRLATLAKPSVRSAPPAEQAEAVGLAPDGPGSLLREGNRVLVEVRFDHGAVAGVDDLHGTGAKIVDASPRYQTVTVAARPSELRALAAVPRVSGASEVLTPITSAVSQCFGAATSEGDEQLRAAHARAEFGVDGSGVTVGILSDSYNENTNAPTNAAEDVTSGDLPGSGNPCDHEDEVGVLDDSETKGNDEGRAMAQIVNDLAPGAKLAFATAFKKTMLGFADNIRKLAEPVGSGGGGANVMVDDVSYFEEPFFQEGPIGVAVREVTEDGVSYFTAAGNNNLRNGGRDIASWEAPQFRDAESCPAGLPGYAQHCMDFNPGPGVDTDFGARVAGEATLNVDLQWAQPWEGVTTDLDAYLLDSGGELLTKGQGEKFNVTSTQRPFEFLAWTNPSSSPQTVRIAIDRCASSCDPINGGDNGTPRLKLALLENGGGVTSTEYESSSEGDVVGPTIFGHSGAEDAMSLGAIRYTTNIAPEVFSSRGPITNYFGPAEGATPAPPLGSPQVVQKPDAVATDGGANTFFGACFDTWRFFGTSAAAPHAAAVAALQLQAKPSATPAEIDLAQREGAVEVGLFPATAVGAGLLDAVKAIEELGVAPSSPGAVIEPPPLPIACSKEESEPEPETKPGPAPIQPSPPEPGQGTPQSPETVPNTFFRRHPAKSLTTTGRTVLAVFRFGSNPSAASFSCKFDRGAFHVCAQRTSRRFAPGQHVVRVKARNAEGKADATPAVYRFQVTRSSGQ